MGTIDELKNRTSVRVFEPRPIPDEVKQEVLACAFAAPTAGDQMLYTILDIEDASIKATLARLCDKQAFIASAPWVLVFLADCRRWYDAYQLAGCDPRPPALSDLVLACEDAMVAAQNAVVAAQAQVVGSCYIGDIVENREEMVALLDLDPWVFPVSLLVFGYPTAQQLRRPKPPRFDSRFIVVKDHYHRLSDEELRQMFAGRGQDFDTFVPPFCRRKYMSGFALEMARSVDAYVRAYARPSSAE